MYQEFDRVGLEHLFWTIEEAEAYLPILQVVLKDLAAVRAKINSLQLKIKRAKHNSIEWGILRGSLQAAEQNRLEILNSLQYGIDVQDEIRGVACFSSWVETGGCYYLVYRSPEEGIQYFCSMEQINDGKILDAEGFWSGRSDGELAHGQLEPIPCHWRK